MNNIKIHKKILMGSVVAATLLINTSFAGTVEAKPLDNKELSSMKEEIASLKTAIESLKNAKTEETTKNKDEEEDGEKKFDAKASFEELKEEVEELGGHVYANHLKFNADFRSSWDSINYKMADSSSAGNNSIYTNRLWINAYYSPNKHVSLFAQLSYNKTFGERIVGTSTYNQFENFDWYSTNATTNDTLKVRNAYFLYKNDTFLGIETPWTFSVGRRESTNGELANYREGFDEAASPVGHTFNASFDGISSKFDLDELTGVKGSSIKFCTGKGATNADGKMVETPYASINSNIEELVMYGAKISFYDDKQYKLGGMFIQVNNTFDLKDMNNPSLGFQTIGDLQVGDIYGSIKGIGEGYNDFLDETVVFASLGVTKTQPRSGKKMLGSETSQVGTSYLLGIQTPSIFSSKGKMGVEYNHGSKYFRPLTYSEDTLIGPKTAVRGDAWEVYFTEPLVDKLYMQVRYTYVNYDYSGSNGFFGDTGTPMTMAESVANGMGNRIVKSADDLRVYIRYEF